MSVFVSIFINLRFDVCFFNTRPLLQFSYLDFIIEVTDITNNRLVFHICHMFGGDYIFVEGAYAHAALARDDVAVVLAEKVEGRYLTEDEAVTMAHKLLRENGARFFRLPV